MPNSVPRRPQALYLLSVVPLAKGSLEGQSECTCLEEDSGLPVARPSP